MKKFTLLFMATMLMGFFANAQIISEDFENFSDGDYVADNSEMWTTWSNAPGGTEDAVISTAFANSGSNSMFISGTNDMLLPCGDSTTGKYYLAFQIYIEDGASAYYNIQHEFTGGSDGEWGLECYFNDGAGLLKVDGQDITFAHNKDEWVAVEHYIDLDNDKIMLYVGGQFIAQWIFSHQTNGNDGQKILDAFNFYNGGQVGNKQYYIDDVIFKVAQSVTFNVDMNAPITDGTFDVANDTIFLYSGLNGFTIPGKDESMMMTDDDTDGIYTLKRIATTGDYEYKYFKNSGLDNGEWTSDLNRQFTIADTDIELNDIFGDPNNSINQVATINLDVYPNPTTGIININTNNKAEVTVINTVGQVVIHKNIGTNGVLNLTNEAIGVYFLTVKTINGTSTRRIIIE